MLRSGMRRSVRRGFIVFVLPASERATGLVATRLTAVRDLGDDGADGGLRGRCGKDMCCLSPGGGETAKPRGSPRDDDAVVVGVAPVADVAKRGRRDVAVIGCRGCL